MKRNNFSNVTRLLLLSLVACSLFTVAMPANAATAPLAELYFYKHGDIVGLAALDTTVQKALTHSAVASSGYNTYSYINVQAGPKSSSSVIRTLADDAVFMISCHAGQGRMAIVDNSNNITRLSANTHSASTTYSLQSNFENTTDKLKKVRLAYFMGCNTYGLDSAYGSLNGKTGTLGVDCTITHASQTYPAYSNYFLYCFAFYLSQGQTVGTALSNARTYTISTYGNSAAVLETVNYYMITGAGANPSSTTIMPAAYGVY